MTISVVIPVYNSSQVFPELYKRLINVLTEITDTFEIITVLDGCTDTSYQIISEFIERDSRVKLIEFSRNFGNQMAITAGLQYTTGDYIIVMDDDLQDPPELIPQLIAKADEGFEVVYAVRKHRKESLFRRILFNQYYKTFTMLTDFEIPRNVGDFCLLKRVVVDQLNTMPENNRYLRGLRSWVGFDQTGIEFDRDARHSGQSGFNLRKYLQFGLNGVISFSKKPLHIVTITGFIISVGSFIMSIWIMVKKILSIPPEVPGYASLATAIFFLGGVQLLCLGIIGQYIGRIYDEVKGRPPFIVKGMKGISTRN